MGEGMPTAKAPRVVVQTTEAVRIEPLIQERIDAEEKFKTYKTNGLIGELSRGIEKLRSQENVENGPHLTKSEIERINEAVNLAVELHIDQKDRPNGEPYINHVLNVARRLVVEYGVTNPDVITAAALHDSVEDQSPKLANLNQDAEGNDREKSLKYISSRFGERVSSIVHSLSNEEVPDDLDTKTKNRMYAEHVAEAVKDPDVALVKLADFSDNALTLERVTDPKRRAKLTEKYMPVVAMFINRVQDEDIQMDKEQKDNLVTKLKSVYSEMEAYIKGLSPTFAESKEKLKILYTAFFVKNIPELIAQFPPKHGKVFAHHSTIAFKPSTLDGIDVGNELSLNVIGRVSDEKGDALLIESPKSNSGHSHITLSCAEGVSPIYSNEMIERAIATGQVDYFESPIVIDVTEGYFNGKADIVTKNR